ncbi:MAG: hypothetical protein Q7R81_04780 [Candidatus Peregrinibacteria bacterium]|nr:hypothetical protein [Candidatus Peregrinibacteria bacterium]
MGNFLAIVGIVGSIFLIKYRQQMGDIVGEADWMRKVGGVYNFLIICAILLLFFCISVLTNTEDIFLSPLKRLFGVVAPQPGV